MSPASKIKVQERKDKKIWRTVLEVPQLTTGIPESQNREMERNQRTNSSEFPRT